MTIAYWCVLVAALLPYLGTVTAKIGGRMAPAANHNPREFLETLSGWPRRAHWYQLNSFEAFPPFAAAVVIATLAHGDPARLDALAVAFVVLRVLHYVCYVADWATLRSLMWFGVIICTVWLFVLGA